MMKKGQITFFVIIGLILAVLILLSVVFKDTIVEQAGKIEIIEDLTMTKEARNVQSDMGRCVQDLAEMGLVLVGLQGGYASLDSRVHHTETISNLNYVPYFGTAYLYFKGQNLVPTKEMMGKQLAAFITDNLLACETQYEGLEVDYGKIKTLADVQDEKIKLDLDLNVKVKRENKESGFSDLKLEVPVRLGTIQSVVDEIVDQQVKVSEEELCISCISRITAKNDMKVGIDRIGDDIFYSLTDEKSEVVGHNFIFLLANKF